MTIQTTLEEQMQALQLSPEPFLGNTGFVSSFRSNATESNYLREEFLSPRGNLKLIKEAYAFRKKRADLTSSDIIRFRRTISFLTKNRTFW